MATTRRALLFATAGIAAVLAAGGGLMLAGTPTATAAEVTVHKTPWCGCCAAWVEHLRASGFSVAVEEHEDLAPIKTRLGVPASLGSCHTATVDGYTLEGHVPAADIRRLLAERPQAAGLAVPGMPVGSPGMEQGGQREPYAVMLFGRDGSASVWARY
jgi:hypothetical protein